MSKRLASVWALLLWTAPLVANNGTPTDPSGSGVVSIQSVRRDGERRFLGRCTGTQIQAPVPFVLTAAHCFISETLLRRYRVDNAALLAQTRARLESAPRSSETLDGIEEELRQGSPLGNVVAALARDLDAFTGYESHTLYYYREGRAVAVPLAPGSLAFPPLHLLSLLLERSGKDAPYDLAVLRVKLDAPSWPLARDRRDLEGGVVKLAGFGSQLDEIQPPGADFDGDGVPNSRDHCPLTRRAASVDRSGCAAQDRSLGYEYREGWHRGEVALGSHPSAFPLTLPGTLETIELRAAPVAWVDAENTMPGKADSGSALFVESPSVSRAVVGVYHGPLGPRAMSEGKLIEIARYETTLSPRVASWLERFASSQP